MSHLKKSAKALLSIDDMNKSPDNLLKQYFKQKNKKLQLSCVESIITIFGGNKKK